MSLKAAPVSAEALGLVRVKRSVEEPPKAKVEISVDVPIVLNALESVGKVAVGHPVV